MLREYVSNDMSPFPRHLGGKKRELDRHGIEPFFYEIYVFRNHSAVHEGIEDSLFVFSDTAQESASFINPV